MSKCCPPGRGCNWRTQVAMGITPGEGCLQYFAAHYCKDKTAALEMADAYTAFESTSWLRMPSRRRTHRAYRVALARCFQAGFVDRYMTIPGFSDEKVKSSFQPLPPWQRRTFGASSGRWLDGAPRELSKGERSQQAALAHIDDAQLEKAVQAVTEEPSLARTSTSS